MMTLGLSDPAFMGSLRPAPTDPNFANVSLLLHGNGTNGSTTIIDSSPTPFNLVSVDAQNAYISTAESVFGGSSLYFSGVPARAYLRANANSSLWFGTEDFTIECFVRRINHTNIYQNLVNIFSDREIAGNPLGYGWFLGLSTDFRFQSYIFSNNLQSTSINLTSSVVAQVGQWYHVAVVRNGTNFTIYVDGQSSSTATLPSDFNIAPNPLTLLNIGSYGNSAFSNLYGGYIDELRITKGVARYTANFTPPTAPFPDA